MLVIGLVKMLNFSKENGDLGGLILIFSPASVRYSPVRCPSLAKEVNFGLNSA